jgi:hypothetical protein
MATKNNKKTTTIAPKKKRGSRFTICLLIGAPAVNAAKTVVSVNGSVLFPFNPVSGLLTPMYAGAHGTPSIPLSGVTFSSMYNWSGQFTSGAPLTPGNYLMYLTAAEEGSCSTIVTV